MYEILSPAGNYESLTAAVRAGADAVYLGLSDFNARRGADNFSDEEFEKAVSFCRVRGVKCYLTLNTQLYGGELEKAVKAAVFAAECGIDGIICADLGLARLLHTALPKMPLHASTQLSVHSAEALVTLKQLGFCRVVPAREMSQKELERLCEKAKQLDMQVEVFIHGALCMCLSGQCLISAFLGGRSGNRGLCAGTCRLPFSVGKGSEYALSLKDLSLIEYMPRLAEMGVTSFKIEGRKKPPEYVAAVTSACRSMKDSGSIDSIMLEKLGQIFSRSGFTDGYFADKTGGDMFGVRTDTEQQLSKNVKASLHELYRRERAAVPISAHLYCRVDEPLQLKLTDGKNTVTATGDAPQISRNRALSAEELRAAIAKLGETPFYLTDFCAELDSGLWASASQLNNLRRTAAELLLKAREACPAVETASLEITAPHSAKGDIRLLAQFRDASQIPTDLRGVDAVIIPAEQLDMYSGDLPVIAQLPRVCENAALIEKGIAAAKRRGAYIILENIAQIAVAKAADVPFACGSSFNAFNNETKAVLHSLGAKAVWLSTEIRRQDAVAMGDGAMLSLYGKTPLMLTKNCPISAQRGCTDCTSEITDRKGIKFPVYCRAGYAQIYNSRPTVLSDRLGEYRGIAYGVLCFCDETPSQVEEVISAYICGEKPNGEYTRGLYDKGVL